MKYNLSYLNFFLCPKVFVYPQGAKIFSDIFWKIYNLGFCTWSMIYFEYYFFYIHIDIQLSPHNLLEIVFFPPFSKSLCQLYQDQWSYKYRSVSEYSVLFSYSIFLSLCQHHTIFNILATEFLKISVNLALLFKKSNIVVDLAVILFFHVHFSVICQFIDTKTSLLKIVLHWIQGTENIWERSWPRN